MNHKLALAWSWKSSSSSRRVLWWKSWHTALLTYGGECEGKLFTSFYVLPHIYWQSISVARLKTCGLINALRLCVIIWHSEWSLSLNRQQLTHNTVSACVGTAVAYTEHGKRMCWYTCGLHRTWQAHVLAHLWPTQNTASACVGTPIVYTQHGKCMCWHTCGLHTTR